MLIGQVYKVPNDNELKAKMDTFEYVSPRALTAKSPTKTVYKGIRSIIPGESRVESGGLLRSTHPPRRYEWINKESGVTALQKSPRTIPLSIKSYKKDQPIRKGDVVKKKALIPRQVDAGQALFRENTVANIKYVDIAQGLFSSYIIALARDNRGMVWLGTYGAGLIGYNGRSFTKYSIEQGLPDNKVMSILFDRQGRLWIGTYSAGLVCFDGKYFHYYDMKTGLPGNKVMALLEDDKGNIWIGTNNGITRYDGNELHIYDKQQGLHCRQVYDLCQDKAGNIWIGTFNSGLIRFDGNSFKHISVNNGLPTNAVWAVNYDDEGNLWLGTYGEGLLKMNQDGFFQYSYPQGFPASEILSINRDEAGNIWVGTDGSGVVYYDGQSFLNISSENSLTNDMIWDVLQDPSGVYWIASYGGGLMKYDGGAFKYITERQGLPGKIVLSVHEDKHHSLWFGTWGDGLVKFDGEHFYNWKASDGLGDNTIWAIEPDNSGNLWLGTEGGGLNKFNGDSFVHYTMENGLSHNEVMCMYPDSLRGLWIGTYDGLNLLKDDDIIRFQSAEGLHLKEIRDIISDRYGNIWIASNDSGIAVYTGNRFYHFNKKHGLSTNVTYRIYEDKSGHMWITTNNKLNVIHREVVDAIHENSQHELTDDALDSLYVLFNQQIRILGTDEGLVSNLSRNIIDYPDGDLWLGTENGVSHISEVKSKSTYANSFQLFGRQYSVENYTYNEGFIGGDVFSYNSAGLDDAGNIWWGTGKMLTSFNPKKQLQDTAKPSIEISSVELFYKDVNWLKKGLSDGMDEKLRDELQVGKGAQISYSSVTPWNHLPKNLEMSHHLNHFTFTFSGLAWKNPEKMRYRFILEGYDKYWNPLTSQNNSTYSNLPPGEYTFRVKALSNSGLWSNESTFSFVILPPWWKTTWFRVLLGVVLILITFTAYQWRIASFKHRQRELEKTVSERTSEISEKNEELHQQKEEILAQRNEIGVQKDKLEVIHKDLTESIEYARFIQYNMFPDLEVLNNTFSDHLLLFYPRDRVSGDFYWWSKVDDQIIVAVADCTGHGVPGALMSMLGISFLREIVLKEQIVNPSEVLNHLRDEVINALNQRMSPGEQKDGLDIALVNINLKTHELQFSGARNPLMMVRNQELLEFKADKAPISVYPKMIQFTTQNIELQSGDQLYLFTDGYPDQFGGKNGAKFKRNRFKKLVIKMAENPMKDQFMILEENFQSWKGNQEQIDDITILGLKI